MAGLPSPILNSCCLFVERWSILRPIHPIIPVPDTFWLGIVPFLSQQDHLRSAHFLGSSTPYRSKRIMVAPGVPKPGIVRMRTAQRDTGVPVWPRTVQYQCCRLAVHRSEPYGVWQRVANRSQIRLELYGHVLHGTARHSTILVSLSNCVPCSTEWPRTLPTCLESGRTQRFEAQSDWNCMDAYCTVPLGAVQYWHHHPAAHSARPYEPGGPSLASVAPYYVELFLAISPPSRAPHWRLLTALAVTGFAECSYQIPHRHLMISHA